MSFLSDRNTPFFLEPIHFDLVTEDKKWWTRPFPR